MTSDITYYRFTCACGMSGHVSFEDPTGLDTIAPGAFDGLYIMVADSRAGKRALASRCPACHQPLNLIEETAA